MLLTIGIPDRKHAIISSCDQDPMISFSASSSQTHCQDLSICCFEGFGLCEMVVVSLDRSKLRHLQNLKYTLTLTRPWLVPQRILSVLTKI